MNNITWSRLPHNGYGALYNTLFVSECNAFLLKQTNDTVDGLKKLQNEIAFYVFLREQNVSFPYPYIYEVGKNYIMMNYLKGYVPLYILFPHLVPEEQLHLLLKIQNRLDTLHSITKIVDKTYISDLLHDETYKKVWQRFEEVFPLLQPYASITKVNGLKVRSFNDLMSKIQSHVQSYLDGVHDEGRLHLIHGDCQFHNIMYHPSSSEIVFIDPRGYFGSSSLFGLKEYDDAKLLFALSGYDDFDSLEVCDININNEDDSIQLNTHLYLQDVIMEYPLFTRALMASIWLGNAHSFVKTNPQKAVYSYFMALYIGTKFLD